MSGFVARHRAAVSLLFFVNGAFFGTWASRIPGVKETLSLTEDRLGLALLALGLGTITALPVTGWAISRFGSGPVTTASAFACCVAVPLVGLSGSFPALVVALVAFGSALGCMDVSMNAQAVLVEREAGRSLMAAFHGLWSLGALGGAGLGGFMAFLGIAPRHHFPMATAALAVAVAVAARGVVREAAEASDRPLLAWPSRAAVGIGLVGACGSLVEGGIADWSGVYLRDALGTGPGFAALGYASFSLAMVAGRFTGDRLIDRYGRVRLLRGGAALTGVSLAVALWAGHPWVAIGAFLCAGLGVATVFPIAFGVAGRLPGAHPGHTIAAVATMAYGGGLIGPPFIGFAARATSLPTAMWALVLGCAAIAALAGRVARDR